MRYLSIWSMDSPYDNICPKCEADGCECHLAEDYVEYIPDDDE